MKKVERVTPGVWREPIVVADSSDGLRVDASTIHREAIRTGISTPEIRSFMASWAEAGSSSKAAIRRR